MNARGSTASGQLSPGGAGRPTAGGLLRPTWDGAVNLNRIGGDVYRMGRHEWLTEAGWQQAHRDGVRTVVDLRADRERRHRDTDPTVDPAALDRIRIVASPTEDPSHPDFRRILVPYLDHPAGYQDYLRIFPERVAAAFCAIAVAQGSVVVHCSAGRDRTGLIAAMLQQLVEMPTSDILDGDETAARGTNDHLRTRATPHPHERWYDEHDLAIRIAERRDALAEFLCGIDAREWLLDNGLPDQEVQRLVYRLTSGAPWSR